MPSSRSTENVNEIVMEGSHPAQPAEPGTLKASLLETPGIENMTEKESAHPSSPTCDVDVNKLNLGIGTKFVQGTESKNESIVPVSENLYKSQYNINSIKLK